MSGKRNSNESKIEKIASLVKLIPYNRHTSRNDRILIIWSICEELGIEAAKPIVREFNVKCSKPESRFEYDLKSKRSTEEQYKHWIKNSHYESDYLCDQYNSEHVLGDCLSRLLYYARRDGNIDDVDNWEKRYFVMGLDARNSAYDYNDWRTEITTRTHPIAELVELSIKMSTVLFCCSNSEKPYYIMKDNQKGFIERSLKEFKLSTSNTLLIYKDDPMLDKDEKPKRTFDDVKTMTLFRFIQINHRIIHFEKSVFFPYSPDSPPISAHQSIFNKFPGFICTPVSRKEFDIDEIRPILYHIRRVLAGRGDRRKESAKYIMSWLAHLVQLPELKIRTMLLFISFHGAGKNILFDAIIKHLLGIIIAYSYTRPELILDRFNSSLRNKILIVFNELNLQDDHDMELLRSLVTDELGNIEAKYQDARDEESYTNFIGLSNLRYPITLEKSDRRFFVVDVNNRYANNSEGKASPEAEAYFTQLREALTPKAMSHFLRYLLDYNISDWDPTNIPMTEARKRLLDNSHTEIEIWLEDHFTWEISGMKFWDDNIANNIMGERIERGTGLNCQRLMKLYLEYYGSTRNITLKSFGQSLQTLVDDEKPLLYCRILKGIKYYYPRYIPVKGRQDDED